MIVFIFRRVKEKILKDDNIHKLKNNLRNIKANKFLCKKIHFVGIIYDSVKNAKFSIKFQVERLQRVLIFPCWIFETR